MSTPFPNEYKLRKVADNQLKACVVCYKQTPNVLITPNNVDFFYVCFSHLKDDNFASHLPNEKYDGLVKEKASLEKLIEDLGPQIEKHKPSIFTKIPGFGEKDKDKDKKDKDLTLDKYTTLQKEREIHNNKLQEVEAEINAFQFKDYSLNGHIFKMRLNAYLTKKQNEKRIREMNNPGFFPTAPTTIPGKTDEESKL